MIPYVNRKWYYRLISGILFGLLTWLLAEVMLNLRYRYFEMFLQPLNYLYAAIIGVFVFESIFWTGKYLDRKYAWLDRPGKRFQIQMLSGLMIVFFWVIIIRLSISYLLFQKTLLIFSDEATLLMMAVALITFFTLAEFGFYLNEKYRGSLAEVERFRKENAEYQFEMLKLQLNPHFLFNSLNTLASLVYEDTVKASEFVRRLSDVYRYVLDKRNTELVLLREEIEFIRSFSFLQGLRFQGMIDFRFDVSEQSLERKIAPMTMQLLIENAVKHNVVSRKLPLQIDIAVKEDDLIITNNLQPKDEQTGTGMGLKNIVSRYAFLTDRKVEIVKEENLFSVTIPLI